MKLRRLMATLYFGAFVLPMAARASTANQVDIEYSLERRISSIVNRYDPMALVRVNVSFRKISAPLPGTSIELKNFSGGDSGSARGDEISGATVTIYTAKQPLPEWIKTEVTKVVPDVKANLDIKPLSEEAQKSMTVEDPSKMTNVVQDFLTRYAEANKANSLRFAVLMGIVALVSLAVGTVVAFAILKRKVLETNRLIEARIIPALQNIGSIASEGQGGGSNKPTVVQATLTAPSGGFGGGGGGGDSSKGSQDVASLSLAALEAIFTDCYWCQRDGYANWLWSAMTPQQRSELCASPAIDPIYFKAIQVSSPERQGDHLDPAYLNPLKLQHLSQEDVARWVEAFLPGYHLLSPIRQATLPVSLKTRLACMNEPLDSKAKIPAFPERPSVKRKLVAIQRLGDLSNDDETTVLHNPAMVPEAMKSSIRSLVWLALRPFEVRQRVLNDFSAEELASAWAASPEVLTRLSEALSEKKRTMLDGYLLSVEVNKKAYVYAKLVDEGLAGKVDEPKAETKGKAAPLKIAA